MYLVLGFFLHNNVDRLGVVVLDEPKTARLSSLSVLHYDNVDHGPKLPEILFENLIGEVFR